MFIEIDQMTIQFLRENAPALTEVFETYFTPPDGLDAGEDAELSLFKYDPSKMDANLRDFWAWVMVMQPNKLSLMEQLVTGKLRVNKFTDTDEAKS